MKMTGPKNKRQGSSPKTSGNPRGSRQKTAPTGTRRRQTTDITYGRADERTQGGRQQLSRDEMRPSQQAH